MKVHGDDMITACHCQHVRHQFCSNGRTRFVLLVHPRIGKARYHCRDPTSRRTLACRDENEEFHKVVVHVAAAGLDDEDVLVPNGLRDLHVDLSVGEFFDSAGCKQDV